MRRTRRSGWLRWFGFVSIQVAIAFLLLELALRLISPFSSGLRARLYLPPRPAAFEHVATLEELLELSPLGWSPFRVRAGFRTNSRSFRTHEYATARTADAYRIMVVGDSFTFACGGVPFDRMWHTRLQQRLDRAPEAPVEVFALGVPGVGPSFYLRLWQLEHGLIDPDLVIVAFFVGNDLTDERGHWSDAPPAPALDRWSLAARLVRRAWQTRHIAVDRAEVTDTEPGAADGPRRGGFVVDRGERREPYVSMTEERLDEVLFARLALLHEHQNAVFDRAADHAVELLERFDREVRDAGAELVVVLLPDAYQVDDAVRERILAARRLGHDKIDTDKPQRMLAARLGARSIATVDLLPALRRAARAQPLYWQRDPHWNVAGNEAAGDAVAEMLIQRFVSPLAARRGDG